jgi:dihydrofolate synthase/folylpolyglutamate synthase
VDNACLALAAAECLRSAGIVAAEQTLRNGLEQARWEGRLERVSDRPDLFLDGAHNPASAKKLAAAVRDLKTSYQRLILVIGILGDKDHAGILAELAPLADRVVATKPAYSRAMGVPELSSAIRAMGIPVDCADTVEAAISLARNISAPDDLILVTGSLYMVGEARALVFPDTQRSGALSGLKG